MEEKKAKKVFVTKIQDNEYYFRSFGDFMGNVPGTVATVGRNQGNLIFDTPEPLKVGDYAEITYYDNGWSDFGYHCHKITPTKEDIKENKLYHEYLNEIAKNAGAFFRDVLKYSKEKILEVGPTKDDLVYGDIKIENLVGKLITSILTYGLSFNHGHGLFWFCSQLSENNLFDSFVHYYKVLGLKTSFYDVDNYPSCVPKKYSDSISVYISTAWDEWNPQSFEMRYGDNYFSIKKLKDRIDVDPYVPGDFQQKMQETVDYSNSKS